MRRDNLALFLLSLAVLPAGCAPQLMPSDDGVLGGLADLGGAGTSSPIVQSAASGEASSGEASSAAISGHVFGAGDYQLFELGSSAIGDEWTITMVESGSSAVAFTVVLFDADYDLLRRVRVSSRSPLRHVLRADTSSVYVGVMPYYNSSGGDFSFGAALNAGAPFSPPSRQVVYLDFRTGDNVQVHRRSPISFPAFDGALLGTAYADHTQLIKDTILATVREDYTPYDVVIFSSDEGPPPTDTAYSTIHFGGSDNALLGLADSVDMYNENPDETGIVYVESFAQYSVMNLAADEMAVMIGNVGSHELGHLLGLYHTKDHDEIMDSTGSAWDLAGEQTFHRGPLEDTVFPTGMENTPRLLEQTLGQGDEPAAKTLDAAKALRYKELRHFMKRETRSRCGLCINPDE